MESGVNRKGFCFMNDWRKERREIGAENFRGRFIRPVWALIDKITRIFRLSTSVWPVTVQLYYDFYEIFSWI
jgi:hypothetical protein